MPSPYRVPTNSHKKDKRQKISNTNPDDNSNFERDVKRLQITPNVRSTFNHTTNKKTKLKGGSMHEIGEINDDFLDEILHKNNF